MLVMKNRSHNFIVRKGHSSHFVTSQNRYLWSFCIQACFLPSYSHLLPVIVWEHEIQSCLSSLKSASNCSAEDETAIRAGIVQPSFFPFHSTPSQTQVTCGSGYTRGSPLLCAFTHVISSFWNVWLLVSPFFLPLSSQPSYRSKCIFLCPFSRKPSLIFFLPSLLGPVPTSCWIGCLS